MKNPCPKCVLIIICDEMCSFKEEYNIFWKDELQYYHNHAKDTNKDSDFDKKYYTAHIVVEEIKKDYKRFMSKSSTTTSGYGSTSSSSSSHRYREWFRKKRNFHEEMFPPYIRRNEYLKEVRNVKR